MRRMVSIGVLIPAAALLLTGCATKGWVREMVGQKGQEIDRRFETVETRVTDGAQRVEGMGFKITGLESSVQQVGETAKGAAARADTAYTRADAAYTRADEVNTRVTRLWTNRFNRDAVETVHVQFRFNSAELSDAAQTSLAALVKELQSNQRLTVDLEGYTDGSGNRDYNVQLAERRVAAVRRYLVQKGIELPRVNAIGLGPLTERGVPEGQKRRVTVKLMLHPD